MAWMAAPCPRGISVYFDWTEDYSFEWGFSQGLLPGEVFRSSQSLPGARDRCHNTALLQPVGESCRLSHCDGHEDGGALWIRCADAVEKRAAVGLGMGGLPILAVPALPNTELCFPIPEAPRYRIGFGLCKRGQILTGEPPVNYTPDFTLTRSLHIILHADYSWSQEIFIKLEPSDYIKKYSSPKKR